MISTEVVLLILSMICTPSIQQPFMNRITYKKIPGLVPTSRIFSSGLNRAVYYHDQTVSIVDINDDNEIKNCYLVEVYEPWEMEEILKNLSALVRPAEVTFVQMIDLMHRCEEFDRMKWNASSTTNNKRDQVGQIGTNALNILSGIVPGTKWCGTGDIAEDYYDLGPTKPDIDRCCRTHDLCPVKIRAKKTRYNLTNYSLYSKSHCACDKALYFCLKDVANSTAKLLGTLYFNLVRIECVDDVSDGEHVVERKFSSTGLKF